MLAPWSWHIDSCMREYLQVAQGLPAVQLALPQPPKRPTVRTLGGSFIATATTDKPKNSPFYRFPHFRNQLY